LFKTARFKIHNPSRHKATMLLYAQGRCHVTLKKVLESALSDPEFLSKATMLDKKGRPRVNGYRISKVLYTLAPKRWDLAPLRDYLIGDATGMLLSHFKKLEKAKNPSNPPTVPGLDPPSASERNRLVEEFARTIEFPPKPAQEERIRKEATAGHRRVAARLDGIYRSWAATRAAGQLLRSLDASLPRPLEFTRPEFERGFLLARKGENFYLLIRLFGADSRYREEKTLEDGFVDVRTGEVIAGRKYPGLVLPLELGREFHEAEFLQHGRPQSAKLLIRKDGNGRPEFYVHIAFEFQPVPIETNSFMGIDRGAAMIGAASIVDSDGRLNSLRVNLEGNAFSAEMARNRRRIAEAQRKGLQKSRLFRVRGRRADIVIGEYANRLIQTAVKQGAQIVLEKIDAPAMGRFLTQSQFRKLHSVLEYKAARAGLPKPIEVPAARTSQTCGRCGHWSPENRPRKDESGASIQDKFLCIRCAYAANADENASHIIALRGLHQTLIKGGRFRKFAEFQQWLVELSGRDGPPASPPVGQ